jgi:O-antigen ligase
MAAVTGTSEATPDTADAHGPRAALRPTEWATIAYAGALLVVVAPNVSARYWTPKVVLVLVALVPGLVVLVRAAWARERAAVAGVALLIAAAVSTVWSPRPLLALLGPYNDGTGWLFVAAVVGAWALGGRLSPAAARMLGSVVLAAAVANTVMTWLQMSSAFSDGLFDRVDGRASGLLGNPVHATAFLVAAFALAVERCREPAGVTRISRLGYFAACALFASGVQLSGGRIGLVLLGLVVALALVRAGWRTTVAVVVLGAVGVGFASLAYPSDSGAASRLAGSSSSSVLGRVDRWRMALPAVVDRPVLGIGPGLYRRGTSPHDTVAAARAFGADTLYQDGHNFVVEYAVTIGLLGVALVLTWLVLAAIGARGELAWFAAFGGVSLLLQPQFVGLTPVLALALGAAVPRSARDPAPGGPGVTVGRMVGVVGALVGLVVAVILVRGDVQFDRAGSDRRPATARRAVQELAAWPDPAEFLARLELGRVPDDPAASDRALRAARVAVARDRSAPGSWLLVGQIELERDHPASAARAYEEALRWNPQSTTALLALARLAADRGDATEVAARCRRARAVVHTVVCPPRAH